MTSNKNTQTQQEEKQLKTKLTFCDHLKLAYCGLSLISVLICAEAPFWILFVCVANFAIGSYLTNTIKWPVEYDENGNIINDPEI